MATYVAFLRAINLGAIRKFPKDAIRAVEAAGFTDVETYINTGNVRFTTTLRSRAKIEAALEKAFQADPGFEVPTFVFTPRSSCEIAEDADGSGEHGGRHYVSLFKDAARPRPRSSSSRTLTARRGRAVGGRAVHLLCSRRATTSEARPTCRSRSSSASPPTAT